MPKGWVQMSDEYTLTNEDERSGLAKFLYGARDAAAKAVGDLFLAAGVDFGQYDYVRNMPIGLEEESDIPGAYDPGIYGLVIGRDSDEIIDFADSSEEQQQKIKNRLAATMAHEMIHATQTVPSVFLDESFDTVGNVVMGWSGLEEGMTEALGNIAMKMQIENWGLEEAARNLEAFCAERGMPATQMSARMIGKMKPELLAWYISCARSGEYKNNNKLQEVFGASYRPFLKNMNLLYDYECEEESNKNTAAIVRQTEKLIDDALPE